jgi:hypothetical protein
MRTIERGNPRPVSGTRLDIAAKPLFFGQPQEERVSLFSVRLGWQSTRPLCGGDTPELVGGRD